MFITIEFFSLDGGTHGQLLAFYRRIQEEEPRTAVGVPESARNWYPHWPFPPFVHQVNSPDHLQMVYLGNCQFLAGTELPLPPELKIETSRESDLSAGYWIVHLKRGMTEEVKNFLDSVTGSTINPDGKALTRWYIPNRSAVVYIDSWETHDLIERSGHVDWMGPYHPAYKLSPEIGRAPLQTPSRIERQTLLLNIDLIPGTDVEAVVVELRERGITVLREIFLPGQKTYDVHYLIAEVRPHQVTQIAMVEGVRFIQEAPDGKREYDLSGGGKLQNRTLSVDDEADSPIVTVSDYPLWLIHNLQGQGQLVGVVDSSIDWNDTNFQSCSGGYPDSNIDNWGFALPNLAKVLHSSTGSGGVNLKIPFADILGGATLQGNRNGGEHGSGVAGAALADFYGDDDTKFWEHDVDNWESWSPSNYSGLLGPGIAHEAQLYFTPTDNNRGQFRWEFAGEFESNMATTLNNMSASQVSATNHSVGLLESNNVYTATTVVHDTAGFDHLYMLQCMAAGNDGAVANALTSQSVAKNVLAVGASDDVLQPENRVTFSSIGPSFDGRIKPEVMAPGNDETPRDGGIASALILPDSNGSRDKGCTYQYTAGTSFSSPTIAGAVALVHQYFEEGRYGGQTPILDPSAALMRAMVINAGHRLTGANLGNGLYPNFYQGWGEPRLTDVLDLPGGSRRLVALDIDSAGGFSGVGDPDQSFNFQVNSSGERLRVTLVWTDEPGSSGTGKKLINDLHLNVTGPGGGSSYLGNVIDGNSGESTGGGSADTLNNVENVIVSSPSTGSWTVTVSAFDGNFSVGQGFALVITGDVSEGTPQPPGQASSPTPADLASDVATNATLSWSAGSGASSHLVHFGTSNPPAFVQGQTGTSYDPGGLANSTTYYWRIDEVNGSGTTTGAVWSFTTAAPQPPGAASSPTPADGASSVDIDQNLSWAAGSGATSHDVYFGTSNPPPYVQTQAGTTFDPGTLSFTTTYYWRIDEVNANGTTTGAVWSFTTQGDNAPISMHVSSIALSTLNVGQGNKKGRATVTVVDNNGDPVAGVSVTGTFAGDYSDMITATTNNSGVATLDTNTTKKGNINFSFCVDDVVGGALMYSPGSNVETCDTN